MTSITRMNKKRGEARQDRIDLIESRRIPKKSPVMAAIEYNKKKSGISAPKESTQQKQDRTSTEIGRQQPKYVKDLHSETLMRNLNSEMSSVKDAISEFTSAVERTKSSEKLGEKSTESSEKLNGQDFSFSRKKQIVGLDKQSIDIIRKIVKEELENSGGGSGGGLAGLLPGGKGGGKPGTPPTVPTGTGTGTPIPVGIDRQQKARPAFNKAGRLGAIFSRTSETKGYGEAIRKTVGLALPSAKILGAAGKAIIPASLIAIGVTAINANDQLTQVSELEKDGQITPEQANQARLEIKAGAGGSIVGSVAGGVAGVVASRAAGRLIGGGIGAAVGGPIGAAVLGAAGGMAGGYLAEKAARYLTKGDGPRQVDRQTPKRNPANSEDTPKKVPNGTNLGTGDGSSPGSEDAVAAINAVSKEFDIPRDEMLSTAQRESTLNPKAKNTQGSSATGLFQHTSDTWNNLVRKFPDIASKYDIKSIGGGRDDRLDAYKSAVMYAVLRNDDTAALRGATTGSSETDRYLTHLLGSPTAKSFIKAYMNSPDSLVTSVSGIGTSDVYAQNAGIFASKGTPRTLEQVVGHIKNLDKSALARAKKVAGEQPDSGNEVKKEQVARVTPSDKGKNVPSDAPVQVAQRTQDKETTALPRKFVTPEQKIANTPIIKPTKVSMTEQRIKETSEAVKVEKERNKPAPVVINAPTNVSQSAPQAKVDYDPRAQLSTRNDNLYLSAVKTQELSRLA